MATRFRVWVVFVWLGAAALAPADEPDVYDRFLDDDTSATLNRVYLNFPQFHTIYHPGDEDWATFFAEEGLPYAIRVEQVGAGLDAELWFYPDGPEQPGVARDFNGFGGDETYGQFRWPTTGRFWLRVRAFAVTTGPVTYTLTVARETGINVGLPTISGIRKRTATTTGDELVLPDSIPLVDGGSTTPLYTRTAWSYPADTFTSNSLPELLLSGFSHPDNALTQPWIVQWHERFPTNFALSRLAVAPAVAPLQPMTLSIQMRAEAVVRDLDDGETSWPATLLQDVSPGDAPERVRVYRWNPTAGRWEVYDETPEVTQTGDGWMATVAIEPDALHPDGLKLLGLFGAAVEHPPCRARRWNAYR